MDRQNRRGSSGWAEKVPSRRWRGPYRDYGWEPDQSALPEFRDPDVHFMPHERERLEPWQRFRSRRVVGPDEVGEGWEGQSGPHVGKGPRSYKRDDERIFELVCERMTGHGQLDAREIGIEVNDGEVTLTGSVPDRRTKRLAEDIADSIYGVQDVHNRLELTEKRGTPARWRDRVEGSSVYPASEWRKAPDDAEAQGMASWGQGKRGARGYYDHGDSEIHIERPTDEEETDT